MKHVPIALLTPVTALLLAACTSTPPATTTDSPTLPPSPTPITLSSPAETEVPTPSATLTATAYALPDNVELLFQGQTPEHEALVREGAASAYSYMASLGIANSEPMVIYVYEDKEKLVEDSVARFGWTAGIRGIQAGDGKSHSKGVIYTWTGQLRNFVLTDIDYFSMGAVVTEIVLEDLAGDNATTAGRPGGHAAWLHEGGTGYLTDQISHSAGFDTTEYRYNTIHEAMNNVAGYPGELWQYEVFHGGDLNELQQWGYLASEYLFTIAPDGDAAFFHFYEKIGQNVEWHVAFEQAFGTSSKDFYDKWSEYRKTRYPTFYQIIGGRLVDSTGKGVMDIWVWVCPPEPTYECVPMTSGARNYVQVSFEGFFFSRAPLNIPLLVSFSTTPDPATTFGYYRQVSIVQKSISTLTPYDEIPDEVGEVVTSQDQATLLTITQPDSELKIVVTLPAGLVP